jgi:hypothetical protein
MRVLERRLRRLEVGLLPPAQTESSRLYCEAMLGISRNRAHRLGLPVPDPGLEWTHHISSLAEIILRSQGRWRGEPEEPA